MIARTSPAMRSRPGVAVAGARMRCVCCLVRIGSYYHYHDYYHEYYYYYYAKYPKYGRPVFYGTPTLAEWPVPCFVPVSVFCCPSSRLISRSSEKSRMRCLNKIARESWDWGEQKSLHERISPHECAGGRCGRVGSADARIEQVA